MTILVTGASAGFGRAIAKTFVKAGYNVIGTARREDKLKALKSELGEQFLPLPMDLRDNQSIDAALGELTGKWADLDLLVNNAGLALGLESAATASLSDWQEVIETNVLGLVSLTRKILPSFVAGKKGYIINIGSVAGNYPYPGSNIYGATKAFVRQFSLNLRADLFRERIRVTNLEPGLCGETEFSEVRFKGDKEHAAKVYQGVDYIKPEDIAAIVLWLYQTPSHLNVNTLEVMPVAQSFAGLTVDRDSAPH